MRLWPRRKQRKTPAHDASTGESRRLLDNHGVDVRHLTLEELDDTSAAQALKDIMRARAAMKEAHKKAR
jgi:hypothetical protein